VHLVNQSYYAVSGGIKSRSVRTGTVGVEVIRAGFPTRHTTGVPVGTKLTKYTGSCRITTANLVIDRKRIQCELVIAANNVRITRSMISGSVSNDEVSSRHAFTISDSTVLVGDRPGTGIGVRDFVATRVHVYGGNRSILCQYHCTVQDSYVHGQYNDMEGYYHESGIRVENGSIIRHNTILCDGMDIPPEAGCSADLTGYGDFAIIQNNTIDRNLFRTSKSSGFCAYGGSTRGKPFSVGANHIRFTNNVFERGPSRKCGAYGPITDFDSKAPGNVWTANVWDSGGTVPPA